MRSLIFAALAAGATVGAAPARAAWYEAKSQHFIIYADDDLRTVRSFADRLERFDAGVRIVKQMADPALGDGNRLTIFVLPRSADVQALADDTKGFLDGFYTGRVSGSLAYVAKAATAAQDNDESVFFHEYAHHIMGQIADKPYPEWYVEGFAEFFSTPKFERDGSIWFGRPAQNRAWGLFNGPSVPLETLLSGMNEKMSNEQRDVFYGRSWLLTHYLLLGSKRDGQLTSYVRALSQGIPALQAAQQTFGDLKRLDHELGIYRRKPMLTFKITGDRIRVAPIEVTLLSKGAAQVILARGKIKYARGQPAEALAAQVRKIQSQFPGDELVELTLAEAELNANHGAAAKAAAERALKSNPASTEALVLKARATAAIAAESSDRSTAHLLFDEARASLGATSKVDPQDPEPLYELYKTYIKEGIRPTAEGLAALHRASDLVPQDFNVRMNSAIAYLNERKPAEARSILTSVAYSPHGGTAVEVARKMIAMIDSGEGPDEILRSALSGAD